MRMAASQNFDHFMQSSRFKLRWPQGLDVPTAAMVGIGYVLMFALTFRDLAVMVWSRDDLAHIPIILAVVLWLVYRRHEELLALPSRSALFSGVLCFVLGLGMFVLGRSQAVQFLEVGALIPISAALLLLFKGPTALRLMWFPLFFMFFMVPLPATLVVAVTTPLKSAVSAMASALLYQLGYPIGRSGVILTVGPYQLLVADACAGLNSMFTLEALGLLYMNIMNYTSAARNLVMALMIIPISFVANIVRVCILVLVTYHFGDEAGQGFVHGFAGMVLFIVALALILAFDHGLVAVGRRFKGLAQ
jgi:exosortase B